MRRFLRFLLLLLVLGVGAAGAAGYVLFNRFTGPGPSAAETTILVARGSGVRQIASQLETAGIVADPMIFAVGVKLFGKNRPLRAGEYRFPAGASASDVMQAMIEGKTLVHKLTVAEGLTTTEILALVAAAEALEGEVPAGTGQLGEAQQPGEGTLLPDTYYYTRGDTRAALVQRMTAAMREGVDKLWPQRAAGLPFATPEEAVALASIVERETALAEERPRVAGVFINRLRRAMPLQADPTVIYAVTKGRTAMTRPLSRADLAIASPYNTYLHAGLPPGPIANPGRASLEAVLHPRATRELYFVADGSGGHVFAETLAAHQRNVLRWRRVEAQQEAAAAKPPPPPEPEADPGAASGADAGSEPAADENDPAAGQPDPAVSATVAPAGDAATIGVPPAKPAVVPAIAP